MSVPPAATSRSCWQARRLAVRTMTYRTQVMIASGTRSEGRPGRNAPLPELAGHLLYGRPAQVSRPLT